MINNEERLLKMYDDIVEFHRRFELPQFDGIGEVPHDLLEFRRLFLREESVELIHAVSRGDRCEELDAYVDLAYIALGTLYICSAPRSLILGSFVELQFGYISRLAGGYRFSDFSMVEIMVDLTHACRRLALQRRFDFDTAWDRVHAANMTKVRATDANGKRKSQWDVVKPEGWVAPNLGDLV